MLTSMEPQPAYKDKKPDWVLGSPELKTKSLLIIPEELQIVLYFGDLGRKLSFS